MRQNAFTLLELLVIVTIFLVLLAVGVPSLSLFQREARLRDTADEMKNVLSLAQSKATSSEGASPYGVFFDSAVDPQRYVLFRGSSFASRDASFDQIYQLPKAIEFSQINFSGGNEVIFQRITGETSQPGSLTIRLKAQPTSTRTISVDAPGVVRAGTIVAPSDTERVKDSRHVHLDYTRTIETATSTSESIILTLSSNSGQVQQTIKISDYLQAGNIVWSGFVTVDGEIQQLEIRTHRLNSPDTQFSITRDRRKNTKALQVSLSGDGTGELIRYAADGATTQGTSLYAGQPIWQ